MFSDGTGMRADGVHRSLSDAGSVVTEPFLWPGTVAEADRIETGQLGAYGACLRAAFNGFDARGLKPLRAG